MEKQKPAFAALVAGCFLACAPTHAQQAAPDPDQPTGARVDHDTVPKANESDIAKESENPIGNLTVLPSENYTNFDVGPNKGGLCRRLGFRRLECGLRHDKLLFAGMPQMRSN